ncbi:TonB-dependent receptor [Sphingomonas sp. DBB INV C78]|uniref:TonB-dependent receptor n=1 Tax=Sphingomonas sp. DBB INV C78 TaxID=3349434 RepID=UPI0036D3E4E0
MVSETEEAGRGVNHLLRVSAAAMILCMGIPLVARPAPTSFTFSQLSVPLDQALKIYGRLSGRQLLYSSDLVAGKIAPPLQGSMTADAALERLLAGSGIEYSKVNDRVVVLRKAGTARAKRAKPASPAPAQPTRGPTSGALPAGEQAAPATPDIIVTGTHIRGAGQESSPVATFDRDDIDKAGYASVAAAISAVPQNFIGAATEQSALTLADGSGSNSTLATGVNLRGLGPEATLVLINGRRMAGAGANGSFSDLSSIPLAATERVEILLDGASALYGSDAVAGVVNIILKDRYAGPETRMRVGTVTDGALHEAQLGQSIGTNWSSGMAMLVYEYQHRTALKSASRDFAQSDDLTPLGGTNHSLFYSHPGNILAFDPVTGAFAPAFAIPAGQDGTALGADDFLPGVVNLENRRLGTDLTPRQTRHSLFGLLRQELSPSISFSADARYSHRSFRVRGPGTQTVMVVTPANPFFVSPTNAPMDLIAYSFTDELGPSTSSGSAETIGTSAELKAELGRDWQVRAYGAYASELGKSGVANVLNSNALSEALGTTPDNPSTSYDPAVHGYFNPYGDGGANSPAVLDFVGTGFQRQRVHMRVATANVDGDGPLFAMPGGEAKLAVGINYRTEKYDRSAANFLFTAVPVPGVRISADRDVIAAFAELRLPLVGPDNEMEGAYRLELSAAVRGERYSDFGTTANPKIGLAWSPVEEVRLRSSFGTSFRAPGLRAVRDPQGVDATFLTDANGLSTAVLSLAGGNPDLEPEKARSWTVGVDATPTDGLTLSATWFRTIFSRRIGTPALDDFENALTNPALAPFVERISPSTNPADLARVTELINRPDSTVGGIFPPEVFGAIIDSRYVNTGRTDVSGMDLTIAYAFQAGMDRFDLSANASYLFHYRQRLTPDAPSVDLLNLAGRPIDLRGRATASWTRGPWTTSASLNYVDRYRDLAGNRIHAWPTVDFQIAYEAPDTSRLKGLSLAFTIQNFFDRDPPFYDSPGGVGYDAANADAVGRFIALQLTKRW